MTSKANRVSVRGRTLGKLLAINNHNDFHDYLLDEGVGRYSEHRQKRGLRLGRVLAICANVREARTLRRHAFDEIVLSSITEPSEGLLKEIEGDSRCRYGRENSECLTFPAQSFDLVICKEGLHHLARPVLGMYEMLRVTRDAILVIEPAETQIGRLFERLGWSSIYEVNQTGNIRYRDNYVYRWTARQFDSLLKSYFLESGYQVDITVGWMTSKFNGHPRWLIRRTAALAGWLAGFVPGSRGNYMTALITSGTDIPAEPRPFLLGSESDTVGVTGS